MTNTYQFSNAANTVATRSGDGASIPWSATPADGPADTGGYVANVWKADGSPVPSAYVAPVLSPQDKFNAAIAAGVTLTWSSSTTLNATYDCDPATQAVMNAEVTAILLNGVFTNGQATRAWLDFNSTPHTFNIVQFKTFSTAVGAYVDSVYNILVGGSVPSANLTVTG